MLFIDWSGEVHVIRAGQVISYGHATENAQPAIFLRNGEQPIRGPRVNYIDNKRTIILNIKTLLHSHLQKKKLMNWHKSDVMWFKKIKNEYLPNFTENIHWFSRYYIFYFCLLFGTSAVPTTSFGSNNLAS